MIRCLLNRKNILPLVQYHLQYIKKQRQGGLIIRNLATESTDSYQPPPPPPENEKNESKRKVLLGTFILIMGWVFLWPREDEEDKIDLAGLTEQMNSETAANSNLPRAET